MTALRAELHDKEDTVLAFQATMKFSDLAAKAKSARIRADADQQAHT
jgi:hypothetical protein